MSSLHIDRFSSRYRLPSALRDEQGRLDRLFADSVEPLLALELDRVGMGAHEEICLREVHCFTRLRLAQPDTQVAIGWSQALVDSIVTAARSGGDLVRYTSRHHALLDVLVSVARGDLLRVWAWRQLGLWSATDLPGATPALCALQALVCEAAAAPAVLHAAATLRALEPLLAATSTAAWSAVARAALSALGETTALVLSAAAIVPSRVPTTSPALARAAERVENGSAILRVVRGCAGSLASDTIRSLIVLAVLEVEPMLLRDATRGRRILATIEDRVSANARHESPAKTNTGAPVGSTAVDVERATNSETGNEAGRSGLDGSPPVVRCCSDTRAGGLLFLLHLVGALDLFTEITSDPILGKRSLRWVLHRLALRLLPIAASDPAALAFAGLRPTDTPPEDDDGLCETEEDAAVAIDVLRRRLVASLRARLHRDDDSDERLLALVCYRAAVVAADPGWIEIRFSLDDVSTEIRRVGLDLHPGWLPWLGVVMRFLYV